MAKRDQGLGRLPHTTTPFTILHALISLPITPDDHAEVRNTEVKTKLKVEVQYGCGLHYETAEPVLCKHIKMVSKIKHI